MKLPRFEYAAPESISKCCNLLQEQGDRAKVIAGGTDLIMALKHRLKQPDILVDLCSIPNLDQITYSEGKGLKIGALVSLRHLATNDVVKERYPVLARAALDVGAAQIQAMGTVGGNLCQDTCCLYYNRPPLWRQNFAPCHKLGGEICHAVKGSKSCWATYCGDLAPVLLALQANLTVADAKGEKNFPLCDLYSGKGENPNNLKSDQVITHIEVPSPAVRSGGAYLKLRVRKSIDYPLLGVAVVVQLEEANGKFKDIAIGLTGVEKGPVFIKATEELKRMSSNDDIIEGLAEAAYKRAHPINNTYGFNPKYRREMVRVYVKSAIRQSADTAVR